MERKSVTIEEFRSNLLKRPGESPDRFSILKSGPLQGGVASALEFSEPAINLDKMTVRTRISTAQVDRVKDIVCSRRLADNLLQRQSTSPFRTWTGWYRVWCRHVGRRRRQSDIHPSGRRNLCYRSFSPKIKISSQIFEMVVEKLIRAASVGIDPITCSYGYDKDGDQIQFIDICELNEWSFCTVACNPGAFVKSFNQKLKENWELQCEAANRILNKRTLDGTAIHPFLMKSLKQMVATNVTGIGFDPEQKTEPKVETKTMKSLTADQINKMTHQAVSKVAL